MPKTKDIDPDVLKLLSDPKGGVLKKFVKHCLDEVIEEADEAKRKSDSEKPKSFLDDLLP